MESLKQFEEICQPDARQQSFVLWDANNPRGFRDQTMKDFYDDAASIQLHNDVPEEIRSHFETARHLIIYSWFYYPLNVTAELAAYTSVEFALRIKAGCKGSNKRGLKNLLKEAVENHWVRDEGFSHVKSKYEGFRLHNETLPPQWRRELPPLEREYCKVLCTALPSLRNELAHGNPLLHHSGSFTVRICAELINQLFRK